jgi:hypothetical protein
VRKMTWMLPRSSAFIWELSYVLNIDGRQWEKEL